MRHDLTIGMQRDVQPLVRCYKRLQMEVISF